MAVRQFIAFVGSGLPLHEDRPEAAAARELMRSNPDGFAADEPPAAVEEAGGGSARTKSGRRGRTED